MESAEIRRRWLSFFEERGHTVVPSASLIADDPTLLLVPAGMVPFKPYFLGEVKPPAPRVTSVQKCVRTPDIEEVGKTTRHGTFFQMCGNFSFGDYFKEGAIGYAWEALTSSVADGGFGLDPERLWITVYLDDDEAEAIWRDKIGVPAERIQRLGKKDNFWSMGVPGPCGPCSEINYDRGPEFGVEGGPAVNDERYVEIWNLVFMQYERGAGDGKEDFPILGDLPSKNIDTGLGLERLAMILQGVQNMYETDTLRVVMDRATELTGVRYGADHGSDVSLRVVADHIRTSVMLIGDGVTPGNEGRGYVLRRIMRRAIRNMRLLGATGPVVKDLVDVVIETMGQQYPELITDRKRIETVALAEEAAFLKALKGGTNILDTAVTETKAAGGRVLAGDKAFLLHDTWGFPIDLTLEMAAEQGLSVDEEGFRRLMKEQRDRAKADARAKKTGHADLSAYREVADSSGATDFTGYTATEGSRPSSASSSTVCPPRPRPRVTRSRWSSTAPRSTPRAAARSPTRAGSGSTPAPSSRSATSRSRFPASTSTRVSSRSARSPSALRSSPRSTSSAAVPSPAPTPPRTSRTRPCVTHSARRPPRPVPRTSPAASASTSARRTPFPARS